MKTILIDSFLWSAPNPDYAPVAKPHISFPAVVRSLPRLRPHSGYRNRAVCPRASSGGASAPPTAIVPARKNRAAKSKQPENKDAALERHWRLAEAAEAPEPSSAEPY